MTKYPIEAKLSRKYNLATQSQLKAPPTYSTAKQMHFEDDQELYISLSNQLNSCIFFLDDLIT